MILYYVLTIVDRDKTRPAAKIYRDAGVVFSLSSFAEGTATPSHLSRYGLNKTDKSLLAGAANEIQAKALFRAAREKLFIDIPGNGIILSIPIKSVAGKKTLEYLAGSSVVKGKPDMNFTYELIVAIMNEGYSDLLMDAARGAGAGGGTVLHAKGTGKAGAAKFFSMSIADEKDVVYIVAESSEKTAIMQAINEKAGPGTQAGAICFSLPISKVMGLRSKEAPEGE